MTISLYAAILGLFYVYLSTEVIKVRKKNLIAIGSAGNELLERKIRVHGNFNEYIPLSLILLFLVESTGISSFWIHLLGIALVIGRGFHYIAVRSINENLQYRVIGMLLTFSVIVISAIILLLSYLF